MTETIRVSCLLDRYWDPATADYAGTQRNGTLIDISVKNVEYDDSRGLAPVGIVVLDDNSLVSVPMEFITKIA